MYKTLASIAFASFSYLTTISDGVYYLSAKAASVDLIILGRIPFTQTRIQFDYIIVPVVAGALYFLSKNLYKFGKKKLEFITWGPGSPDYFELISL